MSEAQGALAPPSRMGFPRLGDEELLSLPEVNATRRGADRRRLVPPALRLHGTGLHGLGRLHGPGQLGDRPRRRRALRLYAALRHHAVEPDGDPAAGAGGPARHRHRPRSGAGLPRLLSAPGQLPALDRLRARDHRLRPRRGDRHGDRAPAALRHPADRRRADRGARRLPGALPDEPRLPLARGLHRRAADRDLRLLRDPDRRGGAADRARCWTGCWCRRARSSPTRRCSTSPWA